MTDYFLLHTHNDENDVYEIFDTQEQAFDSMMDYIRTWWDAEMDGEPISDPITREDADAYFSDTGEWANIVKLNIPKMETDVLSPGIIWKNAE